MSSSESFDDDDKEYLEWFESCSKDNELKLGFKNAIYDGNLEIIEAFVEKNIDNASKFLTYDSLIHLANQQYNYTEIEKLEVLKYLWPRVYAQYSSKSSSSSPFKKLFGVILKFYAEGDHLIIDFIMKEYYTMEQNTFSPILKELQSTIGECQPLCIFLHSEIPSLIDYYEEHLSDEYFFFEELYENFRKILRKDSLDAAKLIATISKVLLKQDFSKIFAKIMEKAEILSYGYFEEKLITEHQKRIFQAIYFLLEDRTIEDDFFDIALTWLKFCSKHEEKELFSLSLKSLSPFILKQNKLIAIENLLTCPKKRKFDDMDELETVKTLKEKCRYLIWMKMIPNVETFMDLVDRVWALRLPEVLKCSLLGIQDADWLRELEII